MIDERSLWRLVAARADRTPDVLLAVDERGERLTFGQYRERVEVAAAGLHERGVRAGTRVAWQLPTWLESMVLVGALARLDAVQVPMLPIYREREVRFIVRETNPDLFVVPSRWRGFEYEELARRLTSELAGMTACIVRSSGATGRCPRAIPPVCRPQPPPSGPTEGLACAGSSTRRVPRPTPKGALAQRLHPRRRRGGRGRRVRLHRHRPLSDGLPVHAHRRYRDALHPVDEWVGGDRARAVRPRRRHGNARHARHDARGGWHAARDAVPRRAAAPSRHPAVSRPARGDHGRRAEIGRAALRVARRARRDAARSRATG